MPTNLAIFFSSIKEADKLLFQSQIKFKKVSLDQYIGKTENFSISVYIAGIGNNFRSYINNIKISKDTLIIKVGTGAVIDNNLELLKAYIPSIIRYKNKIIKLSFLKLSKELYKKIKNLIINKKLLTVENPLVDNNESHSLFLKGNSIIDMETYHLVDKFKNHCVLPIIVGTDRGGENSKKAFFNNLRKASFEINKTIENIVNIF